MRFSKQALFHPLKYMAALVQRIGPAGGRVFEQSEATAFERAGQSIRATVNGHTVTCQHLVLATDVPLIGVANLASATLLQSKMALYTSYAVGAVIPKGIAAAASFWDTGDPYFYLRIDHHRDDSDYAVFGGLDHKTGQVDHPAARFDDLEARLRRILPAAQVEARWSGQIIESHDGLPLLGETATGQFVATGYSGNGLTFGTVGALMACDAVVGRKNPWRALFNPNRFPVPGGAWNYLAENIDYPYYMVKDRLAASEAKSLEQVAPGEGKLLSLDGKKVAAYRDQKGHATVVSRVCTHMGCVVHWNDAEASWDCPCHGSRFRGTGEVITGPAEAPLQKLEAQNGH